MHTQTIMVEISDTPLEATRAQTMSPRKWAFVMAVSFALSSISWGMDDSIRLGNADGLEVQVEFLGFRGVGKGGTYKYMRSDQLRYRVIIRNRAPFSFKRIETQSSLRTDGKVAALLPGPSISMAHNFSLSPGEIYDYETSYMVPDNMNPATTGKLLVRLQYVLRDRAQATIMTAPLHFLID